MRKQFFAAAALAMGTALAGMSAAAAGDTLNFGCFSYADTLDPAVSHKQQLVPDTVRHRGMSVPF